MHGLYTLGALLLSTVNPLWWQAPTVFVAFYALDFVWARYNVATTQHHRLASANYAAVIALVGGFGIMSYTENHWLLIPCALGAWAGTFHAVTVGKRVAA